MKHIVTILLCVLCALSCTRIPLYEAESGVYLRLNVRINANIQLPADNSRNTPTILNDKITGKIPEQMQVNFYDVETHSLVYSTLVGSQGGYIDVAPGIYDMIIYNIGTDVTHIERKNSRGGIYAYTSQVGSRKVPQSKSDDDGQQVTCPVILEPDHLYVARMNGVVIPERSDVDETIEIYAEASTLLETYIFRACNISNIQNIASVKAYITGQARAKCLWDGRYIMDQAIISVDCYPDVSTGEIVTVFNTFGKYPNALNDVFLTVVVANSAGEQVEYVFDVTNQFDDPDNTSHEIIVTDEINIPEPGSGQGGFNTDVDEWEENETDINI